MSTPLTFAEAFDSLTGYDELAIKRAFGAPLAQLRDDEMVLLRAVVFVLRRRDGLKDDDAHKAVMEMPGGVVRDYFAADDELMPEEPETEAGKGD